MPWGEFLVLESPMIMITSPCPQQHGTHHTTTTRACLLNFHGVRSKNNKRRRSAKASLGRHCHQPHTLESSRCDAMPCHSVLEQYTVIKIPSTSTQMFKSTTPCTKRLHGPRRTPIIASSITCKIMQLKMTANDKFSAVAMRFTTPSLCCHLSSNHHSST